MIWVKYETWDYMDKYPEYGYHLFENYKKALEWAEHMRNNYSGGTTRLVGPANKEELLKYIDDYKIRLDDLTLRNVHNDEYYKFDKFIEDKTNN